MYDRDGNRREGGCVLPKNDPEKFFRALHRLESDPKVAQMKRFSQHRGNPTFVHCRSVAVMSFLLAQRLGWRIDEAALARGAMLHDFHLYSFRGSRVNVFDHAFGHPRRALENAERLFPLSGKEKNIIVSHMWPLTLFTPPRSKEAFLVTLADKLCALREMGARRR